LAICGSAPSSPFAEPEPSVRGSRTGSPRTPLPSSASLHQAATASSPTSPTPSPRGPLAVGEHCVFPISCGTRPSSRGRASSLERSPPCPYTPLRRRAYAGDVGHRSRLGKSSVAGAAAVTPGFKGKPECKNTCAPGSSYTHASTQ
jgi:hypothetical protein